MAPHGNDGGGNPPDRRRIRIDALGTAREWNLYCSPRYRRFSGSGWDDFCYSSDDSNILLIPATEKAVVYIEERWFILNWRTSGPVFKGQK